MESDSELLDVYDVTHGQRGAYVIIISIIAARRRPASAVTNRITSYM
jgi:hypothetical protein